MYAEENLEGSIEALRQSRQRTQELKAEYERLRLEYKALEAEAKALKAQSGPMAVSGSYSIRKRVSAAKHLPRLC